MRRLSVLFLAAFGIGAVGLAAPAGAQQIEGPWRSSRSPGFVDIGMSGAYRTAILRAELDGVRPHDMIRGAGGTLFVVDPFRQQAFIRGLDGTPVPRGSTIPGRAGPPGRDRDYDALAFDQGGAPPLPVFGADLPLLVLATTGGAVPPYGDHSPYSAAIDAWIALLATIP